MQKIILSLLLIFYLTITGCAEVKIDSIINPKYQDQKYQRVLVVGYVDSISYQRNLEDGLIDKLKNFDNPESLNKRFSVESELVTCHETLFAGDPNWKEKIYGAAKTKRCDAILFILPSKREFSVRRIEGPAITKGEINSTPTGYQFYAQTQNTNIEVPNSSFYAVVDLVDLESLEVVWHSEEFVSGEGMIGINQMTDSFLSKVAGEIITKTKVFNVVAQEKGPAQ